MAKRDLTSMRSALDYLISEGDVYQVKEEVDPILEISGITKRFDGGPVLLFEKIKGYPNARDVANVIGNERIYTKLFGASNDKELMQRCHQALLKPIPPKEVESAPVQEVVYTENIDAFKILPVLLHSEEDAGRILGGENILISGKYFEGGHEISFKRTHFIGPDWGTLMAGDHTHIGKIMQKFRGQKVPVTLNLCAPPAVLLAAGGAYMSPIAPFGTDELGFAGGLQGFPVEIVRAKTVDAWAVAQAEWVVEGYLEAGNTIWESAKAAASGKWDITPYFPEYTGYLGGAVKTTRFQVTAITHRKDRPIFYSPLAHSIEGENLMRPFHAASIYELCCRIAPEGLVNDVNILQGQKGLLGVTIQVKKTRKRHEGYQKNLLETVLTIPDGPQVGIVVDDDVDIYSAEDVIWALTTRVNPATGIFKVSGDRHRQGNPMEELVDFSGSQGSLGIDATVPFELPLKGSFKQGKYPIDLVDPKLEKWFTKDQIAKAWAMMPEYGRVLAKRGS
jgi:4-hydroxy-3-polyprenylbenzoate decarboxylase